MSLPEPRTEKGRTGLAAMLARPRQALISSDFDGTIAPIVSDPADSRPTPQAVQVFRDIAETFGQVAIITGRTVSDILTLSGLEGLPGLIIEGQHGAERYRDGRYMSSQSPPEIDAVRQQLPMLLRHADPKVWVEDKNLSLVVHTRQASAPEDTAARLSDPIRILAEEYGLWFSPGRNALEIRPPGTDKGQSLRRIVEECDAQSVLFSGDDLGDVPAFDAVDQLRSDGIPGLTVCSYSTEMPVVAEHADLVLDGPTAIVGLLRGLVEAVRGRP